MPDDRWVGSATGLVPRNELLLRDFFGAVQHCARCGGDHEQMRWRRFGLLPNSNGQRYAGARDPDAGYTHWGFCPTLGEPILLTVSAFPDATALNDTMDTRECPLP